MAKYFQPFQLPPPPPKKKMVLKLVLFDVFSFSQDWLRWTNQVNTVVDWFRSEKPVNLVLFYLDQPGDTIRFFGPESEEVDLAVYKVLNVLFKL